MRFGDAHHGWIGIDVQQAETAVAGSEAEMTKIKENSPAADSGLKEGDILLQVGKVPVHEPDDVIDASFFISAGDSVPITVMRGDQKMTFNVEAGSTKAETMASAPSKKWAVPLRLDASTSDRPSQ